MRKLTFTGSTEVGAELYKQCAPGRIRSSASSSAATRRLLCSMTRISTRPSRARAIASSATTAGPACANRIYVQEQVCAVALLQLSAAVAKLKTGSSFDDGVVLGPLIDKAALEKVEDMLPMP